VTDGYTVTIVVTARDDFPGRSTVRFGVGEFIDLVAVATPPADLRWFIESDTSGGTLINNTAANDGTALYTAGHTAGDVTLVVKVLSGAKAGAIVGRRKTITVVTPTDAVMVQEPDTYIYHQQGTWSVGLLGNIFLRPTDVSFNNTNFQEGECTAKASGYLSDLHPNKHPLGIVATVGDGDAKNGCMVNCTDTVHGTRAHTPYEGGDFLWKIPWRFGVRVPSPGKPPSDSTKFTTADQHATADATGRATIAKAGAGPFFADANDPTSGYHDPTG
jgi:hypothetical protein